MARKMTDKQVLSKVALILCNEAEFWRGMDYPTAKKLHREYLALSRRIFEMAAKKRSSVRRAMAGGEASRGKG